MLSYFFLNIVEIYVCNNEAEDLSLGKEVEQSWMVQNIGEIVF